MKDLDFFAYSTKFFSLLSVLLLPIRSTMVAVGFLVIADLITGIWASAKEKKKITSHRLRRTVIKTLAYMSAVLVAFILEKYLMDDMPITKVVSGLIGITEGKSFFENLKRITGIDFWSQILTKLNLQDIKNSKD